MRRANEPASVRARWIAECAVAKDGGCPGVKAICASAGELSRIDE